MMDPNKNDSVSREDQPLDLSVSSRKRKPSDTINFHNIEDLIGNNDNKNLHGCDQNRNEPKRLECDQEKWKEMDRFASEFRTKRIKLGYTQGDVGRILGNLYGNDFSQTTISRFEALNLSLNNLVKLKPLLELWLQYVRPNDSSSDMNGKCEPLASLNLADFEMNRKQRKRRCSISESQRRILEQNFQYNVKPSQSQILALAQHLTLETSVVRVWYCNSYWKNINRSGKYQPEPYFVSKQKSMCDECRFDQFMDTKIRSICSVEADQRGPNQKIISFSYYKPSEGRDIFYDIIEENIKLVKKHYPGYVIRLYTDALNDRNDLCNLFCQYSELDLCDVNNLAVYGNIKDYFGMIWRFAPMADPLVSEWHSRDVDSKITEREASAVQDWKWNTNKNYHIMRDHPNHKSLILGGMFGMRLNKQNREDLIGAYAQILEETHFNWKKGLDQAALSRYVGPLMGSDVTFHDSYFCEYNHPFELNRPFPTQRESSKDLKEAPMFNFVGANEDNPTISIPTHSECPLRCRPEFHQDWLLC